MGSRNNGEPSGETKAAVKKVSGPTLLQESSPLGTSWKTRMEGIKKSQTPLAPEPLEPHFLVRSPATASEKTSHVLLCAFVARESS